MHTLDLESADGLRLEVAVHPAVGSRRLGAVVAAHDLALDMDQGGMFMRLAERLSQIGFDVLRFSFRGHGGSEGEQREVTVEGEVLDLRAAVEAATSRCPGPLSIVAAGFAAVPVAMSLPDLGGGLRSLALWGPTLDLASTFVEPRLRWGLGNFGPMDRRRFERDRVVLVDGEFEFGWAMFGEMSRLRPDESLLASRVPILIAHGDRDDLASHDIARRLVASREDCRFHSVRGADHGFETRADEDEVLAVSVSWLEERHAPPR